MGHGFFYFWRFFTFTGERCPFTNPLHRELVMTESLARSVQCALCDSTYTPVFEPEEDATGYGISCSSCSRRIHITTADSVRAALRTVLSVEGEALALAIETYLADCFCGQRFAHDSGQRCESCLRKIRKESEQSETRKRNEFKCIWDIPKMKEALEGRLFEFILDQMDSEQLNLNQLVELYESGQIDPGTYMEKLEELRFRESRQVAVIKTWAMLAGPEMAFRAVDENGITERYGSRILVSIAMGLEMGYGLSVLNTLTKEEKNLDGPIRKEISIFLRKIGNGF